MSLKRFPLHPASVKEIRAGHYWVTEDKFSAKLKKAPPLFIGTDQQGKSIGIFLNDPDHKTIRARFWKKGEGYSPSLFLKDLEARVRKAIDIRKDLELNRENYFLVFGAIDELPGLEVLKLGPHLVFKLYSSLWLRQLPFLEKIFRHLFPKETFWKHNRSRNSNTKPVLWNNQNKKENFLIKEQGITYQVFLGDRYDYGIYTDASALRVELKPDFMEAKKMLNLYSYTGAFSLYGGLVNSSLSTTSVDISEYYQNIFKNNLELNQMSLKKHSLITDSVQQFLKKARKDQDFFDLIIIDPPPASSDGDKVTKAIQVYPKLIEQAYDLLSPNGKIVALLNHRKTSRQKFKKVINDTITKNRLYLTTIKELFLTQDCGYKENFPESDYLKGLVLSRD